MKEDLKCFMGARVYLLDWVQCERTKSDRLTGEGCRNSSGCLTMKITHCVFFRCERKRSNFYRFL